jgi:hypothetical protein
MGSSDLAGPLGFGPVHYFETRPACCESFVDPGKWVEGAIAWRDARIPGSKSRAASSSACLSDWPACRDSVITANASGKSRNSASRRFLASTRERQVWEKGAEHGENENDDPRWELTS